jgi:hypothetical protein
LNINIDGTYSTADGNYTVIIRDSDEDAGTFKGEYIARDTPQEEQIFGISNGSWNHVGSEKLPLSIGFDVHARPEGRPWVMRDSWVGFMRGREGLCIVGIRSYLTANDRSDLFELGRHSFELESPYSDHSMPLLPCRSDPTLNVPSMFIHEVTGTYLMMDNHYDNVGQCVQVWNRNVPRGAQSWGHKWLISRSAMGDNFCLLRSDEQKNCLAVGETPEGYPRLERPEDSLAQQWQCVAINGRPDTFAIIPRNYPDHALGLFDNYDENNRLAVLTRMWGRPNMFQYWRQYPLANVDLG